MPRLDAAATSMVLYPAPARTTSLSGPASSMARLTSVERTTRTSGFVSPMAAMLIGAVAAVICYYAIRFRQNRNLDESMDVWACHGMASTWGMIATGLFATLEVNSGGANGLFYGNPMQFVIQAVAVVASIALAFGVTYGLAKVLGAVMGLRVSDNEEEVGLDISAHGERAYS